MIEQKSSKTQKTKVISLYEETPKQFFNPYPDPKNSQLGPKKVKNDHKIKSKSKIELKAL